jgi:arylsulfatase A-like enzyme
MVYEDLGLVQPEGGSEVGELMVDWLWMRKVPELKPGETITVVCAETGENFTFSDPQAFAEFKYQRYMKRYLRTIQSIDENVGRLLDHLDAKGLAENTLVIYTSDQGFFLGEHGWFDKRFMYEESLQMPFLVRYPKGIKPGSVGKDIASNVDFAPTFLDYAGLPVPTYMQGRSLRPVLEGNRPDDWKDVAYHRYWMHNDEIHEAWAHYGVRDRRYKLIYWYNDDLGQLGARPNDAPPEWELFDCQEDPFELMNLAGHQDYRAVFLDMLDKLDAKMAEIGDIPEHDSAAMRKAPGA